MGIERSHGKARPTLPRASDLDVSPTTGADAQRAGQRDGKGRFASGNAVGRGRGWQTAIRKLLGKAAKDPIAAAVAADAWKIFAATKRELPDTGPSSLGLAALKAQHAALAAFWAVEAAARGLTTAEGIAAQEHATKHGQRAERLTVTMIDVSSRLAAARPKPSLWQPTRCPVAIEDDDDADDDDDHSKAAGTNAQR